MREISVQDLMVPLEEYVTVPIDATLFDAVMVIALPLKKHHALTSPAEVVEVNPLEVPLLVIVAPLSIVNEPPLGTVNDPADDKVPLLVSVAPEGRVNVSPLSPNVKAVPVAGLILFALISLAIVSLRYG